MAFTAVGALIAGEAVTAAVVLAAVAEVGIAMTVVGAVTGNEDLLKIGGVLSMVGGIGGMINGAMSGAAVGASTLEGAAGGLADSAASTIADTALNGADLMSDAFVSSGATGAGGFGAEAAGGLTDLAATMPNPTDMRLASGTQTTPTGTVASEMQASPTVNDVNSPTGPQGPQGPQAPRSPADLAQTAALATPGNAPQASGNFWKSFSSFAEKNKTLFSSGLQMLGGAMKGANDRDMWDQKMALEQQRVNQTSHGNEVGNFAPRGVIAGARA